MFKQWFENLAFNHCENWNSETAFTIAALDNQIDWEYYRYWNTVTFTKEKKAIQYHVIEREKQC
jgi:hypothetical protein